MRKSRVIKYNLMDSYLRLPQFTFVNASCRAKELAHIINSKEVKKHVLSGKVLGYLEHTIRLKYGTPPPKTIMKHGKHIKLVPAIKLLWIKAKENGEVTYQVAFLNNKWGRQAYSLYKKNIGRFGCSMEATQTPIGITKFLAFYGFDYVTTD